jgi:anti-sigma factor RsiW
MKRDAGLGTLELCAYLDGELSADDAAAIERAALERGDDRRRLERLKVVREALAAPVPELETKDLARAMREASARRASAGPGPAPRSSWMRAVLRWASSPRVGALAVAAAVALGVGGSLGWLEGERRSDTAAERADDFRAKAGAPSSATRWAGAQVYRLAAGGDAPERLQDRLAPGDGLLFSYTNLGAEPFAYLMLFAVDAAGRVHWFYPAVEEGQTAASIPIAAGRAEVALPELIRAELAEGPLVLYSAFTRAPLDATSVAAWLEGHPEGGSGFAPPGSAVAQLTTLVAAPGVEARPR